MSTIEYEQLVLQAKSLDYSRRVSLIDELVNSLRTCTPDEAGVKRLKKRFFSAAGKIDIDGDSVTKLREASIV